MELYNWLIQLHSWSMKLNNWFMVLHNSITEPHKSIALMEQHNSWLWISINRIMELHESSCRTPQIDLWCPITVVVYVYFQHNQYMIYDNKRSPKKPVTHRAGDRIIKTSYIQELISILEKVASSPHAVENRIDCADPWYKKPRVTLGDHWYGGGGGGGGGGGIENCVMRTD